MHKTALALRQVRGVEALVGLGQLREAGREVR
jgi:hypothetical protein